MARSTLAALALLAGTLTTTASAQQERPAVTVPLPSGSGVFYYRAGTPGGVRIRSRTASARPDSAAADAGEPLTPAAAAARARRAERDGVSRLDLLLLERNLLDAIDQRAADRSSYRAAPLPVPLAPARPGAPGRVAPYPVAPAPLAPAPAAPVRDRAPAGTPSVQEIERSILETGLFRTTAVHFEFARAELLAISTETLDVLADVLARYPALRVEVGGHTDSVGSDALNDRLSQRRAESVVSYLISVGIDPARLSAVGYGERQPVASNDSETGRALNRRVEFTVLNPEAARQETVREVPAGEDTDDLRRLIRDEIERLRDDS